MNRLLLRGALASLVLGGALSRPAAADTFGGFGGGSYLVSPDRLCTPLSAASGQATGTPSCTRLDAAALAKLDLTKAGAETGAAARFTARVDGKRVVVARADGKVDVVAWTPIDPLVKVGAVYADARATTVAVEVVVRRMGREATDIVGFAVGAASVAPVVDGPRPPEATPATVEPPALDAAGQALVKKARKAKGKKALAAWAKVQALDPDHSEARFRIAAAYLKLKQPAEAIKALEALASSARADAIEFLVAARFDKAFKKLANDPAFRVAVGLDRGPTQLYDRIMGTGGNWEQQGTNCDKPTVALAFAQARTFVLKVKTVCDGQKYTSTFKGKWRPEAGSVTLVLPNKGADDEFVPCTLTAAGDEDSLACKIDEDLDFVALPVRR